MPSPPGLMVPAHTSLWSPNIAWFHSPSSTLWNWKPTLASSALSTCTASWPTTTCCSATKGHLLSANTNILCWDNLCTMWGSHCLDKVLHCRVTNQYLGVPGDCLPLRRVSSRFHLHWQGMPCSSHQHCQWKLGFMEKHNSVHCGLIPLHQSSCSRLYLS